MLFSLLFACGHKNLHTQPDSTPIQELPNEKQSLIYETPSSESIAPQMPTGLPKWDDLDAPMDIFKPVAALALSFDFTKCYKEWFQGDSLPPSVRKHNGRILQEDEATIGRLIQCPEERKSTLLQALNIKQP